MASLLCGSSHVSSNGTLFECLVTLGAGIGFLSCVDTLMCLQIGTLVECLVTLGACNGFLSCVDPLMCLNMALCLNALSLWEQA